jgi:hypothetical protein
MIQPSRKKEDEEMSGLMFENRACVLPVCTAQLPNCPEFAHQLDLGVSEEPVGV